MKLPPRCFKLIFLRLLLIVVVSVVVLGWYAEKALQKTSHQEDVEDLTAEANLAAFRVALEIQGKSAELDAICLKMARVSLRRVTVVLPTGDVVCDSAPAGSTRNDDPSRLAEILEALAGREAHEVRRDAGGDRPFLYAAVPLRSGEKVIAALRLGVPDPQARLQASRTQMLWFTVAVILLGGVCVYLVARRIVAPIENLTCAVEFFAAGDMKGRLAIPPVAEIATLARTLNSMADRLDARISFIEAQRLLQETILAGMDEGVIATDLFARILLVNRTAAGMIGLEATATVGTSLLESPEFAALGALASRALASGGTVGEQLAVGVEGSIHLLAHGTPLHDSAGALIGSVLILRDVSRLQRLEGTRQDFVDNVSHELRSPIAIIKGYLELLLGGALGDPSKSGAFLEKVLRQAERMREIVDDLLLLSRLDQQVGGEGQPFEAVGLKDILAAAVADTRDVAAQGSVGVELECGEELLVPANPQLLTLAVSNLLRNAVAHTGAGGRVLVRGDCAGSAVTISVRDWGAGIAREHLPRVFERFYRVDKGRSRDRGGSGLGLAIVKHIVLVHGGSVSAESEPGQGSTFTIGIPSCGA